MKEELLHFLWKHKLLSTQNLQSTKGKEVQILKHGWHNTNEGADFMYVAIQYENVTFEGSIEIHLKSSDWNLHNHSQNSHYKNVILHLVYEDDVVIEELEAQNIPTVELKNYIPEKYITRYKNLKTTSHQIPCEALLKETNISINYTLLYDKLNIEKLERNYDKIMQLYEDSNHNWEAVLFMRLAYVFGLKINADIFLQMAQSIPFLVVQRTQHKAHSLLALLLGKAGLLYPSKDNFQEELYKEYLFLKHKYKLSNQEFRPKFLRLRPANFPTIKLSLLTSLYHRYQNLFSFIINENNIENWKKLFAEITTHSYFFTHYNFGKKGKYQEKKLSSQFIELVLINAIIPVQFSYRKSIGKENVDTLELLQSLSPEKNALVSHYKELNFPVKNAYDSQAIIELYNQYCIQKKCLHCNVGFCLLSKND